MTLNNHIYSDLDLRFMPSISTGDVSMRYDTQSVISSVKNLLNINKYERPFQPDICSNIRSLLFEPVTSITASLIENEIVRVINNHEPRVKIHNLVVSAKIDQNAFNVFMTVFIGNLTQPTSINFILTRTR